MSRVKVDKAECSMEWIWKRALSKDFTPGPLWKTGYGIVICTFILFHYLVYRKVDFWSKIQVIKFKEMKVTNNLKEYRSAIYVWAFLVNITLLFAACSKDENAKYSAPVGPLRASLDQTNVAAGTPLTMSFTGIADSIFFYSGMEGHKYEYRNRSENEDLKVNLSFTSTIRYGYQENTIQLLLSTNFVGDDYSPAAVNAATWQDITRLATWATTWPDKTPSGTIDLTPFHVTDRPIVIAFRFLGKTGTTQRDWGIENYYIRETSPTIDNELANVVTAEWKPVA